MLGLVGFHWVLLQPEYGYGDEGAGGPLLGRLFAYTSSCGGYLLALGLLLIAVTAVRPIDKKAGTILSIAGAVHFFRFCCCSMKSAAIREGGVHELGRRGVSLALSFAGLFEQILFYGLVAFGLIVLFKAIRAKLPPDAPKPP